MPDWLRRRLITLMPAARATEVRQRILGLINDARFRDSDALPNRAMFGREPRTGLAAAKLYDDEVLVDFLLEGQPEDFEIAVRPPDPDRSLWQRLRDLDPLRTGTIILALAYTLAAWWITPGATDGPPVASMILPVIVLGIAALACLTLLRPVTMWMGAQRLGHRLGPPGLVCAIIAGTTLITKGAWFDAVPTSWPVRAVIAVLALALLPMAEQLSGRTVRTARSQYGSAWEALRFLARCAGAAMLALLLSMAAAEDDAYGRYYLAAILFGGLSLFAWGRRPALPETRTDPDMARQREQKPLRRAAPFVAGFLLLVPILWHVAALKSDQGEIAAAGNYQPIVATSTDGLVAVSQADATSVRSGYSPSGPLRPQDMTAISFKMFATGTTVEIDGLAVALLQGYAYKLVVANLNDGTLAARSEGFSQSMKPTDSGNLPVGPRRIAISPSGVVAVAQSNRNGRTEISLEDGFGNGKARRSWGIIPYHGARGDPPVTAIASVTNRLFLFSAADGSFGVVDTVRLSPQAKPDTGFTIGPSGTLPSGATILRALPPRGQTARFIAVASDGAAVRGSISPKLVMTFTRTGPFSSLATGPVVPWVDAKRAVLPTPVPPTPPTKSDPKFKPPLQPDPKAVVALVAAPPREGQPACATTTEGAQSLQAGTGSGYTRGMGEGDSIAAVLRKYAAVQTNVAEIATSIAVANGRAEKLNPQRMAAYLATILYESGRLRYTTENLNYSAQQITRVWPRQFPTLDSAKPYANRPTCLANRIYAGRMGNGDEASGDGARYRGRGLQMVTGRINYEKYSKLLGEDLVGKPELLSTNIDIAVRHSMEVWRELNLNADADKGDMAGIRRKLSGTTTGASEVQALYNQILSDFRQISERTQPATAD